MAEKQTETKAADAKAEAKAEPKKIVRGVQVYQSGVLRTFAGGDEDELEKRLTPGEAERLLEEGSITGSWNPAGEAPPPMARSRAALGGRLAARAAGPHPAAPEKPGADAAEAGRLRAENERLKADLESHQKARDAEAARAGHKKAEK